MWTNGKLVVDEDTDVIQELWRQLCLPEDGQDPGIILVENAFINYVNEGFDPWEVLMYCDPDKGLAQYGIEGCGREEFFFDWLNDIDPEVFAEIVGLAGWREIDG